MKSENPLLTKILAGGMFIMLATLIGRNRALIT
jgi:hypothetical protein